LQGNYADWVSDFLENSGQERLRQDDPRLTADDYGMPDWCFLDDQNPDWDEMCRQWNDSKYTQVDANIEWQISDGLSLLSTTGISEFESSGVSDWQLMGMEFRPAGVNSDVLYSVRGGVQLPRDPQFNPRALPLTPCWAGFAANTIAYGALSLCLWAGVAAFRRRRRARRALCPFCSYPRAGLAPDSTCPECGP
jgi:hypothetical protein